MKHTKILAIVGVVGLLGSASVAYSQVMAQSASVFSSAPADDSLTRVAERLQARIADRFGRVTDIATLRKAIAVRRAAFANAVTITLNDKNDNTQVALWDVSLGRYPEWMTFSLEGGGRFALDHDVIERSLTERAPDGLSIPSFAVVTSSSNDGKVDRVTIEGEAKDGQTYDADELADTVVHALTNGDAFATATVEKVRGAILYENNGQTLVLKQMGIGRSEFHSSPWGRKQNVRKAMNEKANGIVIAPGTTFSFNSTLGGAISHSNGWYDSLIIVNGRDLEPAPGGGICQAATTVFRAAVSAGLPIVTRKSHSLYVTYYKRYGMGLDATVFPGRQDMTFQNDTAGPLILVGKTDAEDNAYSVIYGVDDDRTVVLDGPYFGSTHHDPILGKTLRGNQVGWIQRVTSANGSVREDLLVATYLQMPKSVALEFVPLNHGAADLIEDVR